MTTPWQPFREPIRTTLVRTMLIAVIAGAVLAHFSRGRVSWPLGVLLILWISFGGHWVELWYLNWLRPRISRARNVQIMARVATWFVAGIGLAAGMTLTARAFGRPTPWAVWWLAGCAFIAVELVAHLGPQLRGRPGFYNGAR